MIIIRILIEVIRTFLILEVVLGVDFVIKLSYNINQGPVVK